MFCEFIIEDINKPHKKKCKNCLRELETASPAETLRANCKTPENQIKKESAGLVAKAVNFGSAMIKHVIDGGELCTQEQIDERMAICRQCEFLIVKQAEPFRGECSKCGCNCNNNRILLNKTAIKTQSCPVGKWGVLN